MTKNNSPFEILRAGRPVELSGCLGKAKIIRESETFCVRVSQNNRSIASRRFSDPACAINWAYQQIRYSAPNFAY